MFACRPKVSLAQVLILPAIVAVTLGCVTGVARIWRWRFPTTIMDVALSSDAARLAVAASQPDRYCVLSCDSETGRVRRKIEVKDPKPRFLKLAGDCDTWAAFSEDGQLEVGRLESGARFSLSISAKLGPERDAGRFYDPRWSQIAFSQDGKLCVVFWDDQIALVDVERRCRRSTVKTQGKVRFVRASREGKFLVATYLLDDRIWASILVDASDGRATVMTGDEPLFFAWVGDDRILSFHLELGTVMKPTDPNPERKDVRTKELRSANGGECVPADLPLREIGPMAVVKDGTVAAVSTWLGVSNLRLPALTPIDPFLRIRECDRIRAIAVSDDGERIAVTDGEKVFLADMKNGTARRVVPYPPGRHGWSVALILSSAVLLCVCIWLFWRARPRKPRDKGVGSL